MRKLTSAQGLGYAGRYLSLQHATVFLGYDCHRWAKHGRTPLWVRYDRSDAPGQKTARHALESLRLQAPPRLIEDDGDPWVPLLLPAGQDKPQIVRAALAQLQDLKQRMAQVTPAEVGPMNVPQETATHSSTYITPPYNGFDAAARRASTPLQNAALRDGRLQRPRTCSICGFSDPSQPKGRGYIYLHLEDYRKPLDILPCCKRCHAALHARFKDPTRWLRILERHGQPGRWFMFLTMDPSSQTIPFDQTYPDSLPGAWDKRPDTCS